MQELPGALRPLVTSAPVARLATLAPDGRPHVVPITFAVDGNRVITAVDHKPKTTRRLQRLRNITDNPLAAVLVDHYEDDWSRLWWVRGDGRARVVQEGAEWEDAVSALAYKYMQYRGNAPEGPAIILTVDRWVTWISGA